MVAAVALVVAAAVAIPALAAAPNRAKQDIIGGAKFVPNRKVEDNMRFRLDKIRVKAGGKVALVDKTKQPHTLSLVKKGQIPRNLRQMEACFGKGPCDDLAIAHGAVNPDTGEEQEPTTFLVNVGKAGFNQPGDSVIVPPGGKVTLNVTGRQDMAYLCAIHPWMLGEIDVGAAG